MCPCSATRLVLPLYALACPKSLLGHAPQPGLAALLLAWVAGQLVLLELLRRYGARGLLPAALRTRRYDYHRAATVRELDSRAGPHPRGTSAAAAARSSDVGGGSAAALTNLSEAPAERDATPAERDVEMGAGSVVTAECVICMCPVVLHPVHERLLTPCG